MIRRGRTDPGHDAQRRHSLTTPPTTWQNDAVVSCHARAFDTTRNENGDRRRPCLHPGCSRRFAVLPQVSCDRLSDQLRHEDPKFRHRPRQGARRRPVLIGVGFDSRNDPGDAADAFRLRGGSLPTRPTSGDRCGNPRPVSTSPWLASTIRAHVRYSVHRSGMHLRQCHSDRHGDLRRDSTGPAPRTSVAGSRSYDSILEGASPAPSSAA